MIDDRPYPPRPEPGHPWLTTVAVIAALLACAAAYRYFIASDDKVAVAPPKPAAEAPAAKVEPAPPPPAPPAFVTQAPPSAELPAVEDSDTLAKKAISGLVGDKAFSRFFIPERLVRRIVATVDNLPRSTAPRSVMPLNPAQGTFLVTGSDAELRIDANNSPRYTPYVRVLQSVDVHAFVRNYVDAYPVLQKAYEELGYPGKYFHHRLLEAINNLLEAPEPDSPPALSRAKVLYEFVDRDLETRSAGQKIMMRMGRDNELAVKAKLREMRKDLVAAGERGP